MQRKYVFAGNRASVLKKMFELELDVEKIWAVKGSYLQRYLEDNNISYSLIENKQELIEEIKNTEFNYFISNGLPIILPVEELKENGKEYINIHPSLLPELRGKDPIPGALLYQKPIGVTCHYMNSEIDSGDIISQIEIEQSSDLEAGLLYQLSFMAEAEVFEKAYKKGFQIEKKQEISGTEIYYSFKEEDLEIDLKNDSFEKIEARIKAFSTGNKGARLYIDNHMYKCWKVEKVTNKYLSEKIEEFENYGVILKYENKVLVRKEKEIIRFITD